MTDRSNYQQVGVDVDEQSFDRLTQRINAARDTIAQLKQANQSVADTADAAGSRLQQAFSSVKSNIDDDINSVAALRAQLTGAADDAGNLGKRTNSGGPLAGGPSEITGLRRTGSALTQLGLGDIGRPVQIAGDIQQVTKEFSQIGDVAKTMIPALAGVDAGLVGTLTILAPLAIAAGAVAAVTTLWNQKLEENKKSQQEAITGIETYYKVIQDGTTTSITQAKQKAQDELDRTQKTLDAEKKLRDAAFQNDSTGFLGDFGARVRTAFGALSTYNEDIDAQSKKIPQLQGAIEGLSLAYDSQIVKANDLAEATLKNADENAKLQIEGYKMIRDGTSKQIEGIIADNKDKIQAYTQELTTLQGIKNPTDDVKKRIAELYDQIGQLSSQSANLTQNVLKEVQAREADNAAIERSSKAVTDHANAIDKQNQAEVDAVKKYNEAVQSAETSADQARLNANQKLQDALVNAAQKAVDDANKALDQLNAKRADNLLSLTRDEDKSVREANDKLLTDQIKAQQQERDDLQTHLENLKQIRDRDAGRQRDDLLNRNFRDLFALSEQKTQDMNTENDRYSKQTQQRQEALDQQQNDEARAFDIQRRERLIAYNNANQDALKQYNVEIQNAELAKQKTIQQAQQANTRELQIIRQGLIDKEALLKQGAINEIRLTQQTEAEKAKIFNDLFQQAQDLVNGASGGSLGGGTSRVGRITATSFANPGYANAGQRSIVNDRKDGQNEGFNGVPFPPGLGLFIPARGGYIGSSGGSSTSNSIIANITINESNNPAATEAAVYRALKRVTA